MPNVGYKYHGNAVIGAMGLVQLKYLDKDNEYRNELADCYSDLFNILDLPYIKSIKETVGIINNTIHSRHLYPIRVEKGLRDYVMEELSERGIYCGVHYLDNTQYSMYNYAHGTCKNAHKISSELISLPLHLHMTHQDVKQVVLQLADIIPKYDRHKSVIKGMMGKVK